MRKKLQISLFLILLFSSACGYAQNVEVRVTGMRSARGQISVAFFKDDDSFQKEKYFLMKHFKKAGVVNGEMTISFTMTPGIYGFTIVDDENSDGNMNYNFIGIPTEGFGFSNYYHSGLTKPHFDVFKFSVFKEQKAKITCKVRYM